MLKRLVWSVFIIALIGILSGYYLWNKPHEEIGKPQFTITAELLAKEFSDNEEEASKKYIGTNNKPIVTEISGSVQDVLSDTSGISISFDTGDPLNGVSCALDKFTKQIRTEFKSGDKVKLKGLITGKLTDIVVDRCVILE